MNRRNHDYSQGMTRTDQFINRHPGKVIALILAIIWVGDLYATGGV